LGIYHCRIFLTERIGLKWKVQYNLSYMPPWFSVVQVPCPQPSVNHIGPVIDGIILYKCMYRDAAKTGRNFMLNLKNFSEGGSEAFVTVFDNLSASLIHILAIIHFKTWRKKTLI
jgi:hypothetical protein